MLADNLTAETAHGNDFLMRMQLLFYISGHGYGHATRSSEVLRELARQQPGWRLHVRSNVPEHLFAGIDHLTFHRLRESLDPGVVEDADSLGIDVAVTLDAIERYYRRCSQILDAEAAWVRSQEIAIIVADFPPLAGEIAAACGSPCVGIGNALASHLDRQALVFGEAAIAVRDSAIRLCLTADKFGLVMDQQRHGFFQPVAAVLDRGFFCQHRLRRLFGATKISSAL